MVYGKNVREAEHLLRDILKSCRTQLPEKLPLRTEDDVTADEKRDLQDRFLTDYLPYGWRHDGRVYFTNDDRYSGKHPGMAKLVELFVEEENARIGEHNRELQKRIEADFKTYN